MPQKPFVMRVHFYTAQGTGDHTLGSGAHHIEYMGSPTKGELLVDPMASERTTLESAAIHAQYAGEREGSLGYFGNMADRPQAAQQSILQAQGPVWRVIASVGEEDALKMGGALITKAGWDQAMQPVVAKMITELGLDPAKVQWIAAVHRHQHHENNPHVHLLLWEHGEPHRKTGEWNKQELKNIKQQWVSQLYQPERAQLGQAKTTVRAEIRETVQTLVTRGNTQQGFQQELVQRLQTLGQMLPGKGRLAYAYMPEPVKAQVQDTIRWLWTQDAALKTQHDRYLDAAEKMATFYWHVDPDKSQDAKGREAALATARQNAERDLIQRLAGPVLKAAHTEAWRAQWQTEHEAIHRVLSDDRIRQVMQGKLSLAELVASTPALLKMRQEAAFRIFEPFSEPANRSQFAGTIYQPPEPLSSRLTFSFVRTERPEKPPRVSASAALSATTWTPHDGSHSLTWTFPLDTKSSSKVPQSALSATIWTPPQPRTWTFQGPQETIAAAAQHKTVGDHILATPFDPAAFAKRQDQATDRFMQRLDKHVRNLAWERGLMSSRHALTPNLHAALMRAMHQAERDAHRTATWLAESQYQRQQAEMAIARNTSQDIAL